MPFFVKDFFATTRAGIVIYDVQVDDVLSRGSECQSSPAYSSLCLFDFVRFISLLL